MLTILERGSKVPKTGKTGSAAPLYLHAHDSREGVKSAQNWQNWIRSTTLFTCSRFSRGGQKCPKLAKLDPQHHSIYMLTILERGSKVPKTGKTGSAAPLYLHAHDSREGVKSVQNWQNWIRSTTLFT